MSLEKKIHQQKFKSPEHKLALNILYTGNWINYLFHSNFKNQEITQQQYNVLRILRGQFPNTCNLRLIKERMIDSMSDASRIVDKLIQKGFVKREENKNDRRNIDLLITQTGLTLLESLDFIDKDISLLFKDLDSEEITQLNLLLDKIQNSK